MNIEYMNIIFYFFFKSMLQYMYMYDVIKQIIGYDVDIILIYIMEYNILYVDVNDDVF